MLQIRELYYSIGDRQLIDGIELMIQPGKRTALIGANGAGKTTLLRILTGEIEYSSGSIIKPKDYKIGYLPQEEITVSGTTVLQAVLEGQKEVKDLENQIANLHDALKHEDSNHEELLDRLGHLEHRFNAMNGYHLEVLAKKILSGLGFKDTDFTRPLSEFSGGWRMRVYLALLLVQSPDLLLLDEPTNHLDLPSLEWLEQYLLDFPGSIIIVSHDRFFIDRVSQEIVELNRGKAERYTGNYHNYEIQKEQKESLLLKRWKEQKSEREKQERFIEKFRYKATKAKQVQSRIKMLDRMEEVDDEPPVVIRPHMDFTLSVEVTSYNDVLHLENMFFKYDRDWVLKDVSFDIYRGDRVCLVGPNGAGKTTLTRLIVDQLQPQQGIVHVGERTKMGYYAQHQVDTLNLDATVYQEIASTAATGLIPTLRDVLGIFQFSGEDVFKPIRVLSGGEKARVSLAKILISPVNFLIMDEPTNHLDKTAREALEKALSKYNGTLLLISHDRYFLDKLVNRVLEIKDGIVIEYGGNYSYYLEKRDTVHASLAQSGFIRKKESETENESSDETKAEAGGFKKSKEQKRLEAEARQSISKERNRLQKEVNTLEEKIELLERRKSELEYLLAQKETYSNSDLTVQFQKEYGMVNKELDVANQKWEVALSQLDEIIQSIS